MMYTEQMLNAKLTMEEEVRNTKRLAHRVCLDYQKKALFASIDKSKLQYLVYCLMALVVVLVAFAMFLKL